MLRLLLNRLTGRGVIAGAAFAWAASIGCGTPAWAQGPATATVSGVVTATGGVALSGATVTFSGPARVTATTGDGGAFKVTVPPGLYGVTAEKAGYVTGSLRDLAVLAGEGQPLTITLSQVDLSSLRTIASVQTAGRGGSTINTGAATTSYVPAQAA